MAKVISRKVWHFRAWRKSFPEWFDVSAHCESHFPNGLMFPRMAKVVSRMVWCFRAWRKLFPKWFGVSAHGESRFPKGLEFPRSPKVISRIVWDQLLQRYGIRIYQGFGFTTIKEHPQGQFQRFFPHILFYTKKSFYGIKLESKSKTYPFIKIKSEQEIHSCPLINILI